MKLGQAWLLVKEKSRVKVHDGFIRAFVTYESVEDPKPSSRERREGRVRAVIVSFSREDIRLLFAGQDVDPSNPAPISPEWLAENARKEAHHPSLGFTTDPRTQRTSQRVEERKDLFVT